MRSTGSEQLRQIHRALSSVQLLLALSHLSSFERQWLEVFPLKLTRMRDNRTVLKPENRARLERLTVKVEEMLERHRRALN